LQDGGEGDTDGRFSRLTGRREQRGEILIAEDDAERVVHTHVDVAMRKGSTRDPSGFFWYQVKQLWLE
jgi:hypothetical protein